MAGIQVGLGITYEGNGPDELVRTDAVASDKPISDEDVRDAIAMEFEIFGALRVENVELSEDRRLLVLDVITRRPEG